MVGSFSSEGSALASPIEQPPCPPRSWHHDERPWHGCSALRRSEHCVAHGSRRIGKNACSKRRGHDGCSARSRNGERSHERPRCRFWPTKPTKRSTPTPTRWTTSTIRTRRISSTSAGSSSTSLSISARGALPGAVTASRSTVPLDHRVFVHNEVTGQRETKVCFRLERVSRLQRHPRVVAACIARSTRSVMARERAAAVR